MYLLFVMKSIGRCPQLAPILKMLEDETEIKSLLLLLLLLYSDKNLNSSKQLSKFDCSSQFQLAQVTKSPRRY